MAGQVEGVACVDRGYPHQAAPALRRRERGEEGRGREGRERERGREGERERGEGERERGEDLSNNL